MRANIKYLSILILACVVCYYTVWSNTISLDDAYIFSQLPRLKHGLSGFFTIFKQLYGHADYRPIVIASYAIELWLFNGINLHFSHLINLLLYILIVVTAFRVLSFLLPADKKIIAFLAVLLFATHPVHSSVVSSLKSRDNLLSMLFGLLAWYYCLRSIEKKWLLNGILAVFFMALALFSKLDSFPLLAIIPLSVYVFKKEYFKKIVPGILLLLIAFLARAVAAAHFSPPPDAITFTENPVMAHFDLSHRIAQSLQTYFYYLKFMLVPKGYWFYFGYDMIPLHELISLKTFLFAAINAAALVLALWSWNTHKMISFGILFFYLSLSYCCNLLLPVAGIIADRYAFIGSLGFCLALAALADLLCRTYLTPAEPVKKVVSKSNKNKTAQRFDWRKQSTLILIGIICVVNMGFTMNRNKDWKDTATLIAADMPHLAHSFEANRIAASEYFKRGMERSGDPETKLNNIRQGLEYALQAQQIYDSSQYINESIGQSYLNSGQPQEAIIQLRKTLQKFDTSRVSLEALGDIYFLQNKFDSSRYFYAMAIDKSLASEAVYFKYLRTLLKLEDKAGAESFTKNLVDKRPGWFLPYQLQSFLLMEQNDSLKGLQLYKISFDKGYRNKEYAFEVQQKLLRFGDTANARALQQYTDNP